MDNPVIWNYTFFLEYVNNKLKEGQYIFDWDEFEDLTIDEAKSCYEVVADSGAIVGHKGMLGFKCTSLIF